MIESEPLRSRQPCPICGDADELDLSWHLRIAHRDLTAMMLRAHAQAIGALYFLPHDEVTILRALEWATETGLLDQYITLEALRRLA